jgi:HD superfamily phosphodiesterase
LTYVEDRNYAEELLTWASKENPGRWVDHSYYVAQASKIIATELKNKGYDVEPNIAYNCGLLHDIGRYKGITPSVIHSYDGYVFMKKLGYDSVANVCVTHSFPIKEKAIESSNGWGLVPDDIQKQLIEIIKNIEWNMYDKILTISDAMSETDGFTIIEKRLVSVAIRNGTNENVPKHWRGFFEIKEELESIIGENLYSLLPDIEKSIFTKINLENPK